jgi:hypothetical protein
MKKRMIALILALALSVNVFCACGKKKEKSSDIVLETKPIRETTVVATADVDLSEEEWLAMQPQEIQIRNICELATMEVYFHSVAKAVKPASSGVSGWGQAERRFWFEYSGSAKIGIDMSQVMIIITDDKVTIYIPHATMIGSVNIDSSSYDFSSVIQEPDNSSFYTSNNITASDVTSAVASANEATTEEILSDGALMMRAETRAVELIRKYIEQISEYSNVDYEFEWGYIGEDT